MTTTATLTRITKELGVTIFGYKCLNSPHDLTSWFDQSGNPVEGGQYEVLTCANGVVANSTFERMRLRGTRRDDVVLAHIKEFISKPIPANSPPLGLYITDTAWRAYPGQQQVQMMISLLLAPAGFTPFPPSGSPFWVTDAGKRLLSNKGVRVGGYGELA